MLGDERPATFYHLTAIGLEGIGGVVEPDTEEYLKELVRKTVDEKLDNGIVDGPASLDEAAAEYAVIAFLRW